MKGELLLFVELIGIVAFSVSGAVSAFRKHMDLFGIIILGACTALGGGTLRDIMLGITPPAMFKNPVYAAVAALASLAVFIPQVRRLIGGNRAYEIVLLVCVGVLTGVGGGVLRDVLAGERPYVFVKHFYACASLIGAVLCVFFRKYTGLTAASFVGGSAVVALRLLAAVFRWKLPKPGHGDMRDGL